MIYDIYFHLPFQKYCLVFQKYKLYIKLVNLIKFYLVLCSNGHTYSGNSDRLYIWGSKITTDGDCSHEIKMSAPWKKSYDQPRPCIKKQRHYFADKGPSSQSYGFSSSHVWM